MASITFWNRIEPRPRTRDVAEPLAARIRDPLWMLTRQWQFGEFRGEDAGSPAFVSVTGSESAIATWRDSGGTLHDVDPHAPLEKAILREPLRGDDLTLQVELGQTFERTLRRLGAAPAIPAFRRAFAVARPAEAQLMEMKDQEAARFLRVVGGRAINGIELWRAANVSSSNAMALAGVTGAPTKVAVETFADSIRATYAELLDGDPPNWRPDRLEYSASVGGAGGAAPAYEVHAARDAELDWHSFDRTDRAAATTGTPVSFSVIPTHVGFRGMPNARFWDFESRVTDFGAIRVGRTDLAKLLVMDFMLISGNDWFVIPYRQPLGSVLAIDSLVVTDVFGTKTLVPALGGSATSPLRERWSMFGLSDAAGGVTPMLLMPPSAGAAMQIGEALEEVRFGRDEMANMVWAIEHRIENALGHPIPPADRPPTPAPALPPSTPDTPPLRYHLQSDVPDHWIPFIPVAIDVNGQIALERAALLQFDEDGHPVPRPAVARVLRPSLPPDTRYRIREEEITRGGTRVRRHYFRTRWSDGSTHLWIARTKSLHALEEESGLRYDIAEER